LMHGYSKRADPTVDDWIEEGFRRAAHDRQGRWVGALIVGDSCHPRLGSTVGEFLGFGLAREPADTPMSRGCLWNDPPAGLGDGTHRSGGRHCRTLQDSRSGFSLFHPPGKCVPPLPV
jgi:hypothetical protein